MDELISRENLLKQLGISNRFNAGIPAWVIGVIKGMPSAESTLREKALLLLLNWAEECGFGYDNIPEYEVYKEDVENMGYIEGMIYIAESEVKKDE